MQVSRVFVYDVMTYKLSQLGAHFIEKSGRQPVTNR